MNEIVGVQFQDKLNPNEFRGREYNYFTEIALEVGDIVEVPTSNGDGIAKVTKVNVPESKIDERVMPLLKNITRKAEPKEPQEADDDGGEEK